MVDQINADSEGDESMTPEKFRRTWFGRRRTSADGVKTGEESEEKQAEDSASEASLEDSSGASETGSARASVSPPPLPAEQQPIASDEQDKAPSSSQSNTETLSETDNTTSSPDLPMNDTPTDNVSAELTESDKREIHEAIRTIRSKLHFIKLTESQRDELMRLGKTGRQFVDRALNLAVNKPGILPRSFDEKEFRRDAELHRDLGEIADDLRALTQQVEDTECAVGSDAFTAALIVYQQGKLAREGADMDSHLEGLHRKLRDTSGDQPSQS
ncbi:MAG: hypothetical protein AAF236_15130 [Verrucomicrobiota bacterium]